MYFGAAYYPEHRDPAKWTFDLDKMAEASVNVLRVGEFAWCRFEPSPGDYQFDWLLRFADLAAERSIGLLTCPPIRTVPAWLVEMAPNIRIETIASQVLAYGSRYSFCINHPLLRERGLKLAGKMAEAFAAHPAVMGWHLDNEYGDEPYCHCPICQRLYQQWLKDKYGEIDRLNQAWGMVFWGLEFSRFDQVPTPKVSKTMQNPGHLQSWKQFRSDCTIGLIREHRAAIMPYIRPGLPVTSNYQALWNPKTDYFEAARQYDVCGMNYYPSYGVGTPIYHIGLAGCRCYKQQPFWVLELRNGPHCRPDIAGNTPEPGEIERLTVHSIANGANGIFYFRWRAAPFGAEQNHGTLVDHQGEPKLAYHEAKAVGGKLKRVGHLIDPTHVQAEVALLYDFPTRWSMETFEEWQGPSGLYQQLCQMMYAQLRRQRVDADITSRDGNWSNYRLLVVPVLGPVDETLIDKLTDYVEAGGTLLWHPLSGVKDMDLTYYPTRLHPKLEKLFGVQCREWATAGPTETVSMQWSDRCYAMGHFFDLLTVIDAEVVGTFSDCWFSEYPAMVRRSQGDGCSWYVAGFGDETFYRDLLDRILADMGVDRLWSGPVPDALELVERRSAESRYLFVMNWSKQPEQLSLPGPMQDLWSDRTVSDSLTLPGHGVAILKRD